MSVQRDIKAKSGFWLPVSLIILGLILGYIAFLSLIGMPKVAVFRIGYVELSGESATDINKMLDYLRNDNSIKAVVIQLNSPGGGVNASADVFMNTVKLREKKPVVFFIKGMAASGGYMWLLGGNWVVANQVSIIGNVGAYMGIPPNVTRADDSVMPTGPFKLSGDPQRTFISLLEQIKDIFVQTVYSQRGDRLKLRPEELQEGRIYFGFEAARLGLVDEVGIEPDAIKKAASLAGLRSYKLIDANEQMKKGGYDFPYTEYKPFSSEPPKAEFPYILYRFLEPK